MAIKPITPIDSENTFNPTTIKRKATVSKSISIPVELNERLEEYRFQARKGSISAMIVEALENYLPKSE